MKRKLICILLIFVLVLSGSAIVFAEDPAPDYTQWDSESFIPADVLGTKYQAPVYYLLTHNYVTGDADGLFHPERTINRAEFATMMAKATGNAKDLESLEKLSYFVDLDGYGWAKGYINGAAKAGMIKGVGNDKFNPGGTVTYAELITVLIRMSEAAAQTAEAMAPTWPENYINFADTYNITVDLVVTDWNATATRGDVAYLLYKRLPK